MFKYNFENLEVWQISLKINDGIIKISKKLPPVEKYILTDQIRRAALSIALNIAEGSGRGSKKGFRRFIRNSIGSACETIACVKIAVDQNYLSQNDCKMLDDLLKEVYFKLIKLDKYLKE